MTGHSTDGQVTLGDHRRLTYRVFGKPNGFPVVALHGTPGSRLKFSATDEAATTLGLTVFALDRWGYGSTDPHPSPTLAAFAADISTVANTLSLTQFALLGVSGGGPYAAAVATIIPERVTALALVSPVGPIAGEPDSEITAFHRCCFGTLAHSPKATAAVFRSFRRLLAISPALAMRIAMARVPQADKAVLTRGTTLQRLTESFKEGLRPGALGPVIDMSLFGKPWQLPLTNASAPARLWLGSHDANVPHSAARRLAARLPECSLCDVPGAGHLWVAEHYGDILAWIAETQKRDNSRASSTTNSSVQV